MEHLRWHLQTLLLGESLILSNLYWIFPWEQGEVGEESEGHIEQHAQEVTIEVKS